MPASRPRSRCSATTRWCAMSAHRSPRSRPATARLAQAASRPSHIDSEALPSAIGLDAARKDDAPVVFDKKTRKNAGNVSEGGGRPAPWKGNVRGPSAAFSQEARRSARSWIEERARKRDNPLLVEGTFRTGTQQHTCLEPHAAVARFDGDQLTVHVSTQAVFHVMELIAKRYKLAARQGARDRRSCRRRLWLQGSLGLETIAAIELARAAKAPVRVAFDRRRGAVGHRLSAGGGNECVAAAAGGRRPEGAVAQRLCRHRCGDELDRSPALARLIYPADAKDLVDFDVVSNLPPGAPFRGPGGPPMAFALEQAVDEAALRMKVDPIQLRKRWDPNPNRQRLYDWAAGLDVWKNRNRPLRRAGRYRRGVGVATGYWLYLWQPGSTVEARGQERPPGREPRDAGHRHRHPHRDRQHGRRGVRPRAPGHRGADRRFEAIRKVRAPAAAASRRRSCPPTLLASRS